VWDRHRSSNSDLLLVLDLVGVDNVLIFERGFDPFQLCLNDTLVRMHGLVCMVMLVYLHYQL